MKVFLLSTIAFVLFVNSENAGADSRLDPHGDSQISLVDQKKLGPSKCTVCHIPKTFKLKPGAESSCTNCHSPGPHSGAPEHMKLKKINCLSCHYPHRSQERKHQDPSFVFQPQNYKLIDKMKIESNQSVVLKKQCVDCHQW